MRLKATDQDLVITLLLLQPKSKLILYSFPLAQKIYEVSLSFKMSEITSDLVLHTS